MRILVPSDYRGKFVMLDLKKSLDTFKKKVFIVKSVNRGSLYSVLQHLRLNKNLV